jgi:hypothetical protein
VRLSLAARDLLVATWRTDRESVARVLPPPLERGASDDEHLVSIVALRYAGGRLGRVPVPSFSQLNVRTYLAYREEPAVFFLRAYVTLAGLGGALFGAPYRPVRLLVRTGRVEAPGLGVSFAYRLGGSVEPGELGRQENGIFEAAGLRFFRIRRGRADWRRAYLTEEPRADVLLALGFQLEGEPSLFYAPESSFETDVPPRKLALPSNSSSRSRR